MSYSHETLKQILNLGGNLVLRGSYSVQTLEDIVSTAKKNKAHVTIECSISSDTIVNLVELGGSYVTVVDKK